MSRALLVAALVLGPVPFAADRPSPLIPRSVILEESQRGNPVLSPDGRRVAYSAPVDGVPNLWVRSIGAADDRAVTAETRNGIDFCSWDGFGEHLLYFKDDAGDENTHLFRTDIRTGETRDLTPLPGIRARTLVQDPADPDTALIHLNARDRRLFDAYRLDLRTGELRLDTENPGDVSRFYADHRLRVRAADVTRPDNSGEIRVRDDVGAPWRTLISWGPGEMNSDATGMAGFTADEGGILVVTSLDANAERLIEVDARTGRRKVLAEDPEYDVAGVMMNPRTRALEAAFFEKDARTYAFFDRTIESDFGVLRSVREGGISIRSRDRADGAWLVRYAASDRPTSYYHYDRKERKATFLFSEDPPLERVVLASKTPVRFEARDGLTLHGYLTLPVGVPARKLPLVLLVHGGPWTRVFDDLDFQVQCLADRGYAVLQVNFRGSTGYGKGFQNAGDREWGGKVILDLVDGKNWAVARGIADGERTAVVGGSFGGYAALAAMAFQPGEFRCGVAVSAFSDANLLLSTIPAYWAVGRSRFESRMGKDPAFLETISPVRAADRFRGPLLLIHNANDARVVQEHADRMAAALRERGKDVTYILFTGAGHAGGGVPVTVRRRMAAIESFLARHLGGRAEPPAEDERWDAFLK